MNLSDLNYKIKERTARIAVIGLGYVGLPVASLFADAGFDVLGVDVQPERVMLINSGVSPIEGEEPGLAELIARVVGGRKLRATCDYDDLRGCDIVLIDVETPVDEMHVPRYQALRSALTSLGPVLKRGALVIVESTIAPGTMKSVALPLLVSGTGGQVGRDFYLGNCPERVMPGKLIANLTRLDRVVGGDSPETAAVMITLYRHIVQADLDAVDWITAELVKTVENTYRDVQIAFANEVALICEAMGGDVWKVRELVNKSPFRNMHLPGAGVGGHCIPKDPWLLVYGVKGMDVPVRLIPQARAVNDSMPLHMLDLLQGALAEAGKDLYHARVLVMGYAYLENSDDTRNSPSEILTRLLNALGTEVVVHDPCVPQYRGDLLEKAKGCDAAILMVGHNEYRSLDPEALRAKLASPVIVDGRGVFDEKLLAAGWVYRRVGLRSGRENLGGNE